MYILYQCLLFFPCSFCDGAGNAWLTAFSKRSIKPHNSGLLQPAPSGPRSVVACKYSSTSSASTLLILRVIFLISVHPSTHPILLSAILARRCDGSGRAILCIPRFLIALTRSSSVCVVQCQGCSRFPSSSWTGRGECYASCSPGKPEPWQYAILPSARFPWL